MLDESIVQFDGRIRVHATKRVESKRNEVMAVPVTDVLVRLDVLAVELLKGRHGALIARERKEYPWQVRTKAPTCLVRNKKLRDVKLKISS